MVTSLYIMENTSVLPTWLHQSLLSILVLWFLPVAVHVFFLVLGPLKTLPFRHRAESFRPSLTLLLLTLVLAHLRSSYPHLVLSIYGKS